MRLLLDTHVVIWWHAADPKLPAKIRQLIAKADVVVVSAASAAEVAIKIAAGRLRLDRSFADVVDGAGFQQTPLTFEHAERLATLPLHHRDPFDRMLAAQAQVEGLTLVTHNPAFNPYAVQVIWS